MHFTIKYNDNTVLESVNDFINTNKLKNALLGIFGNIYKNKSGKIFVFQGKENGSILVDAINEYNNKYLL